jgi:hypothetical protein
MSSVEGYGFVRLKNTIKYRCSPPPTGPVFRQSPGVLPLPSEGDFSMQRYVHEENILLYRKLLADTLDEEKRKIILRLLAEEEAKELPVPSAKKK